ncbi:cytidine deaminase [Brachybacterium sp. FME24]|uniref:cytidine deaminase n=1 Tax=Brachybacterium sp. FME24 TaxID=2742605 RepID=UPI001867CEDD|nr:cytidine deaminase [Brachybacterium sp. FME24]
MAGPAVPIPENGQVRDHRIEEPFGQLLDVARDLASRAYAPYSHYPVGAAALVDDGRIVSGCNVENAGYGVTLCAECGLISELIAGGGGKLTAFACVNGHGEAIMPCGRCRQLLSEHAAPGLQILTPLGVQGMDTVLPQAFGPNDIEEKRRHD